MPTTNLTPAQLTTLKAKVSGDTALAALWSAGTPVPIAEALSDPANQSYSGTVTLTSIDKASLLVAIRPALLTLPGLSSTIQAKWESVKADIRAVDSVAIDAVAIGLFGSAVTDGVLAADQAAACYQRRGSWAEVNFGAGIALAWTDVVAAMNS